VNVAELSAALRQQAEEMEPGFSPQLATVHARVRRVRRRRATGAVLGAAAIVATAALTVVHPRGDSRPEPVAPRPLVFPEHVGRYHLVAAQSGEPGESRITVALPRPSQKFAVSAACRGPQDPDAPLETLLDTRLVVNGTNVGGVFCSPHPEAVGPRPSPIYNDLELRTNGVDLRSRSLVLSLTLVRGRFTQERVTDPDAVLGLAVYARDR
jgi:hypothetical protein